MEVKKSPGVKILWMGLTPVIRDRGTGYRKQLDRH